MDLYNTTSYKLSEILTKKYSTSFSLSSTLFEKSICRHIYAIYGLVRIADEVVDTYRGEDAEDLLDTLEQQVYKALITGYSTNPLIHSFAQTARTFSIGEPLIAPFFKSMRTDLNATSFTKKEYEQYIYGSAEVVGLMCLKVITNNDARLYNKLKAGASATGSTYQKVNFLRDIKADYEELGRCYFPKVDYSSFSETDKLRILEDINLDFQVAASSIKELPENSKKAVKLSFLVYGTLLKKLQKQPVEVLKSQRVRVSNFTKLWLYLQVRLGLK